MALLHDCHWDDDSWHDGEPPFALRLEPTAADSPTSPPAKKFRERRPAWDRMPYGVRVAGNLFQLRVYFGGYRNEFHNFGLYRSIFNARRTGEKALSLKEKVFGYLEVLARLKASGDVPACVQPRWVYVLPSGLFGARCKWAGGSIDLKEFNTPEAAHIAMRKRLEWLRECGKPGPRSRRPCPADVERQRGLPK